MTGSVGGGVEGTKKGTSRSHGGKGTRKKRGGDGTTEGAKAGAPVLSGRQGQKKGKGPKRRKRGKGAVKNFPFKALQIRDATLQREQKTAIIREEVEG